MTVDGFVHQVDRLFNRKRERVAPTNVNTLHEQTLGLHDRVALWVTGAIGTMWAVYCFAIGMAVWMLWQFEMGKQAFDPYPFAFLLFLGNIVQLLLMPLLLVGQNIQGRHSELRAEAQYRATVASFHDAEHIMEHLVALDRELLLHRELLVRLSQKLDCDQVESGATLVCELPDRD